MVKADATGWNEDWTKDEPAPIPIEEKAEPVKPKIRFGNDVAKEIIQQQNLDEAFFPELGDELDKEKEKTNKKDVLINNMKMNKPKNELLQRSTKLSGLSGVKPTPGSGGGGLLSFKGNIDRKKLDWINQPLNADNNSATGGALGE